MDKKIKPNKTVNWPKDPYFFVSDVFSLNPSIKEITLRVRLSKEISTGTIAEIGCKTGEPGRPRKVFAFTPVPESTLELAKKQNISLVDNSSLQRLSSAPPVTSVAPAVPVVSPSVLSSNPKTVAA